MEKIYIACAKRSAVGSFLGGLSTLSPGQLGGLVAKDVISSAKLDASLIDEVVVGNVLSAGQKQGVGRQVAILAGIPQEVPAWSMNIICGSGLKSVMNAAQMIGSGMHNLILAGGTESMSQAPYVAPASMRKGVKMGELKLIDTMINDALTDAFHNFHMGVTAENIAAKYNISRQDQDTFAFASQQRAIAACDAGKFVSQITPIEIASKKETIVFAKDEYINRGTTLDKLAKLRPAFKSDGSVTAGNASGINDGAAFMIVASESAVKQHNLTPLVEIVGMGTAGVDPTIMGLGPTPAIAKALQHAKLKLTDIDLIELNEAFAAQSLGVMTELEAAHGVSRSWFNERTNLNGGAIAIGHPVGASGARVLVTLIHEMVASNRKHGLASLCIGGGMGVALVVKRV
jgi:acetyl-CoA C-acetyltransferase